MANQYRKKPVVIEAIRWTGENDDDIESFTQQQWALADPLDVEDESEDMAQVYDELHGTWILMRQGDWVIRGVRGEFYPCTNDVFEETYEPVEVPT